MVKSFVNLFKNLAVLMSLLIGLAVVLLLALLTRFKYYGLLFMIIPLVFLWLYSIKLALHKAADNIYSKMQTSAFVVVSKGLCPSFSRVKFIGNSETMLKKIISNLNLTFWAKLDQNGLISLIVKDENNVIVYEESTKNYVWFLENFYIYTFFTDGFDF